MVGPIIWPANLDGKTGRGEISPALRKLLSLVPDSYRAMTTLPGTGPFDKRKESLYPPQDLFSPKSMYPPTQSRYVASQDFAAASAPPQLQSLPPVNLATQSPQFQAGAGDPLPGNIPIPLSDAEQTADNVFAGVPSNQSFGQSMRVPNYRATTPPALETQIQNINAQTMQGANGKQQEVATMSDLQRMAQAYFGGRTKEQRQKEAFMNIAAGLASGKSPNFMENLGGAVSGAITFDRDDTNRREKEALEGFIKIQGQDDARLNNQMENEIRRESNDIAWANNDVSRINATRERSNDGARFRALNTEASNLRAIMKAEEAKGSDTSPYKLRLESIAVEMFQLNGGQLPPMAPTASEGSSPTTAGWSLKRVDPKG